MGKKDGVCSIGLISIWLSYNLTKNWQRTIILTLSFWIVCNLLIREKCVLNVKKCTCFTSGGKWPHPAVNLSEQKVNQTGLRIRERNRILCISFRRFSKYHWLKNSTFHQSNSCHRLQNRQYYHFNCARWRADDQN